MLHRLESIDDPRLDIFRNLRGNNRATERGLFIAEGPTVVRRLLASSYDVDCVLLTDAKWGLHRELPSGVDVYRVSNALASELVGFNFHAGVLAAGVRRPGPDLTTICAQAANDPGGILLAVAIEVIDRQNVGAIIRSAAAFGATAAVFGPRCSDPFSRQALRVSMGNGLSLPVCQPADLWGELQAVRKQFGVRVSATVLAADATPVDQTRPTRHRAVLFGNESHGLPAAWIERCDERITIPMQNGTDSLNVGLAAGIFLYELRRR